MSRGDWLKVVILVILPVNAWMGVLYYLHWQKRSAHHISLYRNDMAAKISFIAEKWGIREGRRLVYPFPVGKTPTVFFGVPPPVGQGRPVLFLNIPSWITSEEVWGPTFQEALRTSPSLHIVLLFDTEISGKEFEARIKGLKTMLQHFPSHRISVIAGDWIGTAFGGFLGGILAILCDGNGIVRAVEFYPELKFSPSWDEEVKDWRPKLHQAVKKVLDKFFPEKGTGAK